MASRSGKPASFAVALTPSQHSSSRSPRVADSLSVLPQSASSGRHSDPLDEFRELHDGLASLAEKVGRVETLLTAVAQRLDAPHSSKEFYTTTDFAEKVGRAEYTCRQWCLNGRINAIKADSGRGRFGEWRISHAELVRYLNHGLIPIERKRR